MGSEEICGFDNMSFSDIIMGLRVSFDSKNFVLGRNSLKNVLLGD